MKKSNSILKMGMFKESFLISFLEDIGFKLLDKSNINQNTKDKKDYKNGLDTSAKIGSG